MKNRIPSLLLGATLLSLGACSGTGATTSQTTTALSSAQCTFQADRAAAEACEQAFRACVAQTGADLAACRATLEACLPALPDGGVEAPMGRPDGFRPGHPFDVLSSDGGFGPPFGDRHGGHGGPGCDGPDAGMRPDFDGPGRHGGGPIQPDAAAITACHDAMATCLAASPQDLTCFSTERSCEQAVFAAAFTAACQAVLPCTSTTDPACREIEERCHEGVDGRPGAFDGGTCP